MRACQKLSVEICIGTKWRQEYRGGVTQSILDGSLEDCVLHAVLAGNNASVLVEKSPLTKKLNLNDDLPVSLNIERTATSASNVGRDQPPELSFWSGLIAWHLFSRPLVTSLKAFLPPEE